MPMTIEEAIDKLQAAYPFPDFRFPRGLGAHRTVAETVLRHMPTGAKILDFGAGPCDKPVMLTYFGYKMYACDDFGDDWHTTPGKKEAIFQFARNAGVELTEVNEKTPWPWQRGEFDMVMLHDVLEHLHDSPRGLLNGLVELVRPGGLLFITVPNAGNLMKRIRLLTGGTNLPKYDAYYWSKGPWRGHVREHVKGDLERLASNLGLEIVELRGCSHFLNKVSPKIQPLWNIATRIVPSWKDSWSMVARKPEGWKPRTEPA